jgi:hypothetical protein
LKASDQARHDLRSERRDETESNGGSSIRPNCCNFTRGSVEFGQGSLDASEQNTTATIQSHVSPDSIKEGTIEIVLLRRAHIRMDHGEQRFSAVSADRRLARLLNVAARTPLLKVERTLFTDHNQPIEYFTGYYPTERYQCRISLIGKIL